MKENENPFGDRTLKKNNFLAEAKRFNLQSKTDCLLINETQKAIQIKNELEKIGFINLTNQTETDLEKVLKQLGKIINTTDVKIKRDSKGLVTTAQKVDFHTDYYKAKFVAWFCHKQTDRGGESLLLDIRKIYLELPQLIQEKLKSIYLFEHKISADDQDCYPLVAVDKNNNLKFHYSLMNEKVKDCPEFRYLETLINKSKHITIKLKENDILIVDNHRMLHGRNAIIGSLDRYLKRFYIKTNE